MADESFAISNPDNIELSGLKKASIFLVVLGLGILLASFLGYVFPNQTLALTVSLSSIGLSAILYSIAIYKNKAAGIKNDGAFFKAISNRSAWAWLLAIGLTGFYVLLYWFPSVLGLGENSNSGLVSLFNPLAQFFKGQNANQWFVYGTLYTLLILSLGIKFIYKYRHNRYQIIRTISVIVAQVFLAYLIPEILEGLNTEKAYFAKDLKYFWPLNYYFFDSWHLDNMQNGGSLGMVYLVWGIVLFTVLTPIITYFVGKRWYCSWICGCGGLAETAGDPFRHLSSKKMSSWKIERWMIHSVMVLVFLMTFASLYGYFTGSATFLGLDIYTYYQKPYGFLIGAMFSGVIGVGFYPLLGNRVWCRFGCPLAGYMGIIQRFKSRFRITTNGGQCISCGNCSTYCEQGIDVRAYAQKGQNIVRASCVGCGVCSAVCPRGVLKLENGPEEGRIQDNPILIGQDGVSLQKSDV